MLCPKYFHSYLPELSDIDIISGRKSRLRFFEDGPKHLSDSPTVLEVGPFGLGFDSTRRRHDHHKVVGEEVANQHPVDELVERLLLQTPSFAVGVIELA